MSFNFNFNEKFRFGNFQKGLSQEAFNLLDANKDGKITKDEENLFDQKIQQKYGRTDYAQSKNIFETNIADYVPYWITDETEREAYALAISGRENQGWGITNDGALSADENKLLLEIQEMNKIANDFIKENPLFVFGTFGRAISQINHLLNSFVMQNKDRTTNIEKLSDEFKSQLQNLITQDIASYKLNSLSWGFKDDILESQLDFSKTMANLDGVITKREAKEIHRITVDLLMSRALQGENVMGILDNLIENTSDPNTIKELVDLTKELQKIVNQRFLKTPAEFYSELHQLASAIAMTISLENFSDNFADNIAHYNQNNIPNIGGVAYFPGAQSALQQKNPDAIKEFAQNLIDYIKHNTGKNLDIGVVMDVINSMPASNKHLLGGSVNLNTFIPMFNEALKHHNPIAINAQTINFPLNNNLRILQNPSIFDKFSNPSFYIFKTTTEQANVTINGIKNQVIDMAKKSYLTRGLTFNQELFNNCFETASALALKSLNNGNSLSMNQVLNTFINIFNEQWVTFALQETR